MTNCKVNFSLIFLSRWSFFLQVLVPCTVDGVICTTRIDQKFSGVRNLTRCNAAGSKRFCVKEEDIRIFFWPRGC